MINAIIGRPRSGKSYESVVYHIMPAIESGRKVITNIPLNVDRFCAVFGPHVRELIEVRAFDFAAYGKTRPFSTPDEYSDPWRNDKGQGPLYVVDECHLSLPKGRTPVPVVEWYSMHGHYGVDVLLLTQSIGKLDTDIRDMIEIVYRTVKNTAFGSDKTYIKKVQQGYRGEIFNTEIRNYKSSYFGFYKSHTQSDKAVIEAQAVDVKPIWQHWTFYGAGVCFVLVLFMLFSGWLNPFPDDEKQKTVEVIEPQPSIVNPDPVQANKIPSAQPPQVQPPPPPPPEKHHPFESIQLHVAGYIAGKKDGKREVVYNFIASQNGQAVFELTTSDLRRAGYSVISKGACLAILEYDGERYNVICDAPRTGVTIAGRNF